MIKLFEQFPEKIIGYLRSVTHLSVLTVWSTNHAPGESPKFVEVKGTVGLSIMTSCSNPVFLNRCAVSSFQVCRVIFCPYFNYPFGKNKEILLAICHFFRLFLNFRYKCAAKFFSHV